jgi:hypothetical protein
MCRTDPLQDPTPPHLTPQAQHLLDTLCGNENWVNRTELARQVGKSALNKWDVILLAKLVNAGLVEAVQVPRHGPISYEWRYRAVDRKSEGV